MSAPVGGWCLLWGVSALGGDLLPGGVCSGGSAPRGMSAPGGCLLWGRDGIPACTEVDTPHVDRQMPVKT